MTKGRWGERHKCLCKTTMVSHSTGVDISGRSRYETVSQHISKYKIWPSLLWIANVSLPMTFANHVTSVSYLKMIIYDGWL